MSPLGVFCRAVQKGAGAARDHGFAAQSTDEVSNSTSILGGRPSLCTQPWGSDRAGSYAESGMRWIVTGAFWGL